MIEELMKWLELQIEEIRRSGLNVGAESAFLRTKEKIYELRASEVEARRIGMTEHDRIRYVQALACNENDLTSLSDAITGLQSTDHPSLVPLHDRLMARYNELEKGSGK